MTGAIVFGYALLRYMESELRYLRISGRRRNRKPRRFLNLRESIRVKLRMTHAASSPRQDEIITVRPAVETLSTQSLPYFVGISERSAGARGLSMYLVVIPPGASAEPHCHKGHETAIYVLKGRVETRYGPRLEKSVINEPGDFVFIPPDLPHQPRNLSESESAHAIVAHNDANEMESVVPYDPVTGQKESGA